MSAPPLPMPDHPDVEVRHSYHEVRGTRIHVAEAGSGSPMVLLHGWPQNWWAWQKVLGPLAAEHRVICPDLRGFGWSDAPPGDYDKRDLAEDVVATLDSLGVERAPLVGHDWGGWVGFLLAIGHPERFSSYLALNILTPWAEPPSLKAAPSFVRLWYQALLATPRVGRAAIQRTEFVRKLLTAGAVQEDAWSERDLDLFIANIREPERIRASQSLYRTFLRREIPALAKGDYLGERTRLEIPALLLFGMKDRAISHKRLGEWEQNADRMAVELRPDSGHFIVEELPEVVADRALALAAGADPVELAS